MPILFACIYLHALLYHIFQYNYYVFCVCPLFVIVVIRTYLCTYLYVYVYMSYVEFSTKTLHKNNIFLTKTKYDSEKFLYLRNNRNCRRVKVRLCSNIFCVFDKTLLQQFKNLQNLTLYSIQHIFLLFQGFYYRYRHLF